MITCQIPGCQTTAGCQCNRIRAGMDEILRRQSHVNILRPAAQASHLIEALKVRKA